jgi:hypothetical protein
MSGELRTSLELDWPSDYPHVFSGAAAIEASVTEWLGEVLPDFVTIEVLTTGVSPGPNGHPVVRITGTPTDLRSILASYDEERGPT